MSLFQSIRKLFGLNTTIDEHQPIDVLENAIKENENYKNELKKAQDSFDATNNDFELKIFACGKLIEKGSKEGEFNKGILSDKLSRITDSFIEKVKDLNDKMQKSENLKNDLESDILMKSVTIVAALSDADQSKIQDMIEAWQETGLIKGEIVQHQSRAIVMAIDEILKATDESIEQAGSLKEIEKAETFVPTGKIVNTIFGELEQQQIINLDGHYANVIVNRSFKEGNKTVNRILLLKRAPDARIAPNQYCLPGGHIEEGETIQQASIRELKEESNLDADGAHIAGKAKCEDGKWAFYSRAYPTGEVALLDGENINACWMCEEEWMEADLFFDLKEHLIALESNTPLDIDNIPTIEKAQIDDVLEKGGQGSGMKSGSGGQGANEDSKYESYKNKPNFSADELASHAENTPTDQLEKVTAHKDPIISNAAKRELERREKDSKSVKLTPEQHKEVSTHHAGIAKKYEKIGKKPQADMHNKLAAWHEDKGNLAK